MSSVTLIGILTSFLTTIIFYFWGGPFAEAWVAFATFALTLTVHLAIQYAQENLKICGKNYGKALLLVFVSLCVACFIPYSFFAIVALGLGLLFWFFRTQISAVENPKLTVGVSILYALIIFGSTSSNMGDVFVGEKIRQLTFNPDDLFFTSMATMFLKYGSASTGLHGIPWVHYHFLSSALYGMLAKLLFIEPYHSFGYANFILVSSLLITASTALVKQVVGNISRGWWLVHLLVLGNTFCQCFGWIYYNHFISESYQMGCMLMVAGMSILVEVIRKETLSVADLIYLSIYLPFACAGKISAGVMLCGASITSVVLKLSESIKRRIVFCAVLLVFGYIGYLSARTVPMKGLDVVFHWMHFKKALGPNFLPYFMLVMFPFVFLLAPTFFLLWKRKLLDLEYFTWFVILAEAFGIGFIALNLTIDSSGYYFSALNSLIAWPLVGLVCAKYWPHYGLPNVKNFWRERSLEKLNYALVIYFSLATIGFYFVRLFPEEVKGLVRIKTYITEHASYQNKYWPLLEEIKKDQDQGLMVYVPKSEDDFWMSMDGFYGSVDRLKHIQCVCVPFYIPIMSGKPAVFGLPDPVRKCYTFHRGYEIYKPEDFVASAKRDYTNEEVCNEVKKLGFHGYYRVTNRAEKFLCN